MKVTPKITNHGLEAEAPAFLVLVLILILVSVMNCSYQISPESIFLTEKELSRDSCDDLHEAQRGGIDLKIFLFFWIISYQEVLT